MLHRDDSGKLWRILPGGGMIPADPESEDAKGYSRALLEYNAKMQADAATRAAREAEIRIREKK